MPIYEYQCDDCNHVLDALQKVNDKPLVDCPECGKNSLRRLISAPNFRLKGEGWYETDFKKENRKNVADQKDEKPEKKESSKSDNDSGKTKKKDKIKDKAAKDAE
jgi:putative FmdB family regulatory protein